MIWQLYVGCLITTKNSQYYEPSVLLNWIKSITAPKISSANSHDLVEGQIYNDFISF